MKSHGGLWERIVSPDNLAESMRRAARGKRGREPVAAFLERADDELPRLARELATGGYRPRPYTQFRVNDPKPRTISCADFRDRVVHHALCDVCAPCIERRFIADSFACRAGKGSHRAVLRARSFAKSHRYFLQLDIRHFFDSVDLGIAGRLVCRLFREKPVRDLWRTVLDHPLPGQGHGRGLPIGNLTSQWLANLYLDGLDHMVKEAWRTPGYIRYMDDMALFADSRASLWCALERVTAWLDRERRLEVKGHPHPIPVGEGIPFLGFRVYPGLLRVQRRRLRRHRALIRRRQRQYAEGEISAQSLSASVQAATGILGYFGFRGLAGGDFEV